jgi:23S rRNA (uracil1939-C5)-methyltransferase
MTEETYEITLDKFAYGGETMGRLPDGRAVFVPYALPGERVRVRLIFQKRGFARAQLIEVIETSSERIAPKCPHFGGCPGCAYQHLPYEAQLRAKADILRDQLTRIGKIMDPPVQDTLPSPQIWNYRNQMGFLVTDRRILDTHNPNLLYLEECHLPASAINEFWEDLEFGANDLFEQISLRHDAADNLMFIFYSDNPETPEMSLEDDISVVHINNGEAIVMGGDDHLVNILHERPFRASATSFSHPNTPAAEQIITHLLKTLSLTPKTTLLELHSGIGTFSAFLAGKVDRLVCVESDATACDDFSINLDEFENVELYQAQAMDVLPNLDFTPDILLVDPPAGGLGRKTLDGILSLGSAELAYVSRDPSTLARDAKRLTEGGYQLKSVTPFDAAPHTAQVDSVTIFSYG